MAAGEGSRWGDYTGVPKHLADPEGVGEPLITRLCRQLGQFDDAADVVVTGPQCYAPHAPGARVVTPDVLGDTDEWLGATKFVNTMDWWSETGRTVIWFGDSWLEDAVVAAVTESQDLGWLH